MIWIVQTSIRHDVQVSPQSFLQSVNSIIKGETLPYLHPGIYGGKQFPPFNLVVHQNAPADFKSQIPIVLINHRRKFNSKKISIPNWMSHSNHVNITRHVRSFQKVTYKAVEIALGWDFERTFKVFNIIGGEAPKTPGRYRNALTRIWTGCL